jgi:LCP family protein required for cell wall assembly
MLEDEPTGKIAPQSPDSNGGPQDDEPTLKLTPQAISAQKQQANSAPVASSADAIAEQPTSTLEKPGPRQSSRPILTTPPQKRKRMPRGWRIVLLVSMFLLLIVAGGVGYGFYYFKTQIEPGLQHFFHPVSRDPNEPASLPTPDDGTITGRSWNILLLGSDNDGKYNFPALLTQVMMVIHIDTVNNTAYMVSIPRDSWVYVPENGAKHKIDQAFFLGAVKHNSFDDGVRLARLTVEKDYGITIDRYAWVGLSGFASVIDTLGGVDIDVTHPIVDDTYPDDTGTNANNPYAYRRIYLAPGPQHLTGEEALEFVRSRHADLIGDIGRTNRQQAVLTALKKKLTIANVVTHLKEIINDLQGKVYTDLSEQEMFAFANYGRTLSDASIQRITLGPGKGSQDYGDLSTVYDPSVGANQDVVLPNCNNIQPAINRIFGLGDVQSCNVDGT